MQKNIVSRVVIFICLLSSIEFGFLVNNCFLSPFDGSEWEYVTAIIEWKSQTFLISTLK